MASDIKEAAPRLKAVADSLGPSPSRRRLTKLGVVLKPVGTNAVNLGGDRGFSGWRRGAPIQLAVAFTVHSDDLGVSMHRARVSAGPWKVAEDGRHQGNAVGFAGPGVNRKTGLTARTKSGGVRKVRASKGRRWNGRTRGKGTWTAAAAAMVRHVPEVLVKSIRADAVNAFEGR